MQATAGNVPKDDLDKRVTDVTIRLLAILALAFWCFRIFLPFVMLLVWGVVLAVAFGPLFNRLESWLGGRRRLAGVVFILLGIGILAVPGLLLTESFLDGLSRLKTSESQDRIQVPPPPDGVAEWPIIGEEVNELWVSASDNLEGTLHRFRPEVKRLSTWLLSTLAGCGMAYLLTMVAVIISGVMLMHAESGNSALRAIGARIAGERGREAVDLAAQAIRSVAYGVVGVAVVQSILSAVGLFLAGVPGAGLWAGVVLILAVAQLPPLLILGPAIVYVAASSDSTVVIALFAIWSLIVSFSDAFLKPLLLGRGMDIPMPVILIGAIGGMINSGILGLFVGAAVMAIGYKLYLLWMKQGQSDVADAAPS